MTREEIEKAALTWRHKQKPPISDHDAFWAETGFRVGAAFAQEHFEKREREWHQLLRMALMKLTDSKSGFVCEDRQAIERRITELKESL